MASLKPPVLELGLPLLQLAAQQGCFLAASIKALHLSPLQQKINALVVLYNQPPYEFVPHVSLVRCSAGVDGPAAWRGVRVRAQELALRVGGQRRTVLLG